MHHSPLAGVGELRAVASPPGHQFQSPAIRRSAGPITMRTSVASINTATASVNPIILTTRKVPNVNAANTTIMIAAALVIRPAVLARHCARLRLQARVSWIKRVAQQQVEVVDGQRQLGIH